MKKIFILMTYLFFIVLFINLADSVAVSGVYSENNPLEMYPGESKLIVFTLQNMAGDSDVKFKANITEGGEIASLAGESGEYLVPLGSNNVSVRVKVKIPEEDVSGKFYSTKIEFSPIPIGNEKEGMVQISLGLSRYFNTKVIEKPQEKLVEEEKISIGWIILGAVLVVAVVAVIIIIYFIIKGVKGRKKDIENEEPHPEG